MEKSVKKPELLAPAGNYESFMSALNSGADAIYLGLGDFNARGNIENFNSENLRKTIEKAHLFGVKVYLTINTLVKNEEIDDILNLVRFALKSKVDAFIIQDIGLAYLLSKKFKGIELHASTQMGIHNLEGVKFLEQLGYSRVVLARETPLSEIRRIKEGSKVEIEYFIQGALCVGFSGNCYLCSLLAGASGNRGKCKQFCRLPFRLDGKEGYYLSTKDFCMLPSLKELVDSGVTSLKIEGRARRPAYVASAVNVYRKAIDKEFDYDKKDIEKLKKVFNRGDFIEGYFKNEKIIYPFAQNHMGVEIGEIINFKKGKRFNEATLKSSHNLIKGDTIKLFEGKKEVAVVSPVDIKTIGKDLYVFTTTANLKRGLKANLIVDSQLEKEELSKKRTLNLTAFVEAFEGKPAKLSVSAEGQSVTVEGYEILQKAENQPLSENDCLVSLSKCGEEFVLCKFTFNLGNVFLRKSELNELRRRAIIALREKIILSREKDEIAETQFDKKVKVEEIKNSKKILFFSSLFELENADKNYDYLVFSPAKYDKQEICYLAEKIKGKRLFLDTPVIANKEDAQFIKEVLKACPNLGIYATNYYALNLADKDNTIVGSELNIFNNLSIEFYKNLGYNKLVLSKEEFDKSELNSLGCELFIDRRPPRLIYFKHCPIKEHFGGNCGECKYKESHIYELNGKKLKLKRKKVVNCHFYLEGTADLLSYAQTGFGVVEEI